MNKIDIEYLVRQLCWQDEQVTGIKYTEEEIQKFLKDEYPFIARMISGSVKTWKQENDATQ